jgi:hypothetical protein
MHLCCLNEGNRRYQQTAYSAHSSRVSRSRNIRMAAPRIPTMVNRPIEGVAPAY